MNGGSGESLWSFAIRVYRRRGISEACLALQERFSIDVNVLLFAAWMGSERRVELSRSDLIRVRDEVRAWHDEVVRPLRAVRQRMKLGPKPAPSSATEALRTKLKAVEIESERIELATLQEQAPRLAPLRDRASDGLAASNMRQVAVLYGHGDVDRAALDDIDRIAGAAAAVVSSARSPHTAG
jgi:uncharacterized protein (TIGR02444 family)